MKTCSKCSETKSLDNFHKHKAAKGGLNPSCKSCVSKTTKDYYEHSKVHGNRKRTSPYQKLPVNTSKCAHCKEIKEKEYFYKDARRATGVSGYCKSCTASKNAKRKSERGKELLIYRRKWASENRDSLREKERLYRENNRGRKIVIEARRRARKKSLPDTLTHDETQEIISNFGGKCAFCDLPSDVLDHFIPLKTERGGTTKENIIPLCQPMNSSKQARNPFEWAETHLGEESKEKFRSTVEYLANINGLTVEQYREFVFSCFKTTTKNKNIS